MKKNKVTRWRKNRQRGRGRKKKRKRKKEMRADLGSCQAVSCRVRSKRQKKLFLLSFFMTQNAQENFLLARNNFSNNDDIDDNINDDINNTNDDNNDDDRSSSQCSLACRVT